MKIYEIAIPRFPAEQIHPTQSIVLGEEGRGRRLRIVIPLIGNEGGNYDVQVTTEKSVVIHRNNRIYGGDSCLLVINTDGGYSKGREYRVEPIDPAKIRLLAVGYGAKGEAGWSQSEEHALLLAQSGTILKQASKYATHYHIWDGEIWDMLSAAEYAARLALEAAEAGEGEWIM